MKNNIWALLVVILFSGLGVDAQTKKWTIEECVNYALEHNISIKQADLDMQLAAIEKKGAIGNFLPSANATASHSWNVGLNQNITTGLLENQTTQFTSAGFSAGIDIYKGLQNQDRLSRARLSTIASQYQLTKISDDVSLNVANSFLQILFNKESIKVQKEQLSNSNRQLNRTQELVNAGSLPRGDLLDIKATVAADNQRLINAENAFLISKLSLAQLLQLDDFKVFDIADSDLNIFESPTMLLSPEEIYAKSKEIRVEVKIARANLAIAQKDVRIARGAFQPTLSGYYQFSTRAGYSDRVTGYELNSANPTQEVGYVDGTNQLVLQPNFMAVLGGPPSIWDQFGDNKGHSFGVQLNVPILNGFSVRNSVERSKVSLERSKIALSQSELDLERNVYTAFTDANGALKAYESALVALDARQGAYDYAQEKYAVGIMNAFDFSQSQVLLSNAQSDVLRTKYDYIFRVKVLEFYFGIPIIQKQ